MRRLEWPDPSGHWSSPERLAPTTVAGQLHLISTTPAAVPHARLMGCGTERTQGRVPREEQI